LQVNFVMEIGVLWLWISP